MPGPVRAGRREVNGLLVGPRTLLVVGHAPENADGIAVLSFLFAGSGPLPAPFGAYDPTADELGCLSFPPCEG